MDGGNIKMVAVQMSMAVIPIGGIGMVSGLVSDCL